MERKSESETIELTIDDFIQLQNKSTNLSDEKQTLLDLSFSLANEAKENSDRKESYILWMLSDASGIYLKNQSKGDVFGTTYIFGNGRSALPEDFSDSELIFFENIFNSIKNIHLKIRIADLLWFLKRKNIKYANFVISNYLLLELQGEAFFENYEYVNRGLNLANQIKTDFTTEQLKKFSMKILESFRQYEESDNSHIKTIAETMRVYELNLSHSSEIRDRLWVIARNFSKNGEYSLADLYFDEASKWCLVDKLNELSVQCQIERAQTYIDAGNKTTGIISNSHYETALQIIQNQSIKSRRQFISKDQENELIRKLEQSGKECISEMSAHSFEFSLPNQTNEITRIFSGKTKVECLALLASLPSPVSVDSLLQSSISTLSDSPLTLLCKSKVFNDDGLIISSPKTEDADHLSSNDPNVIEMMYKLYLFSIQTYVLADVSVALRIIVSEHKISYEDVFKIVKQSNLIPHDRVVVFSKGLLAGFEYDFMTALHLLVPQIENMIRFHLKNAGVVTFTYDSKKEIEDEASINRYVKTPEFEKIFGKNYAFEIKALLVEKTGCNFRNKLAHGTLSEKEMNGVNSIYFWWFCFKLVCVVFSNNLRNEEC